VTVLDTSALVAVLSGETAAPALIERIAAEDDLRISAGTLLEALVVLQARYGDEGVRDLRLLLHAAGARVVPFDADQVELAHSGFVRFGKGRHPAALNLGDLHAYALAKAYGAPVLYVGDDFARTDVAPAS
jgi:ribonuclease VapC